MRNRRRRGVEHEGRREAEAGTRHDRECEHADQLRHRFVGHVRDDDLEGQEGAGRADRIDQDALCAQDRPGRPGRTDEPEQWSDHRRAGDHEYGTEHERGPVRDPEDLPGAEPGDEERGDRTDADQSAHHDPGRAQLARREVEPALEEDHGDRQRHQREQRAAQQLVGVDDPGDGTEDEPGDQQGDDRRDLRPPRQPLGEHAGAQDQGQRRPDRRLACGQQGGDHGRPVGRSAVAIRGDGSAPGRACQWRDRYRRRSWAPESNGSPFPAAVVQRWRRGSICRRGPHGRSHSSHTASPVARTSTLHRASRTPSPTSASGCSVSTSPASA